MSERKYSSLLPFLSLPFILSYYIPWLSFVAFLPIFHYFEKKQFVKPILFAYLPYSLFIFSGIYKSTHTYYGLFFLLSLTLVLLLAIYQTGYILAATHIYKSSRLPLPFFAVSFVALEFLKNKLFYGMPIGNLNILTYNLPFFIKDASLLGSLYIDLKIILINIALFYLLKKRFLKTIVILAPIVAINLIPLSKPINKREVSLDIVQGNIPQQDKWKENLLYRNLERYINLSKPLKAELVIWPESAYPYIFDPKASVNIKKLVNKSPFALMFGALTKRNKAFYNSVVFYTKKSVQYYHKRKLVPFAEFVPFSSLFHLSDYNFAKGKKGVIFKYKQFKLAPLICYEENFENLSRQYKQKGANLIAVLTNDAWFDKTPTFTLFPRSDVYRAVENRIWLARSANTGLSFIVNPDGKIEYLIKPDTTTVLKARFNLTVYPETFYDRFGWFFGYFMLALTILLPFCRRCRIQKV